jgi:hypothetical protein
MDGLLIICSSGIWSILLCGDWHAGYACGWLGDRIAVRLQAFDVEGYSFANELLGCFVGRPGYAEAG